MQQGRIASELIAPCGANCGVCLAFFGYRIDGKKRKYACTGCRSRTSRCAFIQKNCSRLSNGQVEYCYECAVFPCDRLKTLDKRYRNKYGMSMVENLRYIQRDGMEQFLKNERKKWKCPDCGGLVCVHNKKCYTCGKTREN
jgi:hypothetical protein